jgi:hypothetical protein
MGSLTLKSQSNLWKISTISILIISALLTSPLISQGEGANPTKINITPKYTNKNIGQNFSITLKVVDVVGLYSWRIKLSFNPQILNCTGASVPQGDIFAGIPTESVGPPKINNTSGIVEWLRLISDPNHPGVTGTGNLTRIDFKSNNIGVSGLTLVDLNMSTYLMDKNNNLLPFTTELGEAKILKTGFTSNLFQGTRNSIVYNITIISNSTISTFNFNPTLNQTTFNVAGPDGTIGYSGIAIRKALLLEPFAVLVTGVAVPFKLSQDASYYFLEFTYQQSQQTVNILQTIIGDINGDRKADMKDVSAAAKAFGTIPGNPRWNPMADINRDNKVDMKDISMIAKQFGQEWP